MGEWRSRNRDVMELAPGTRIGPYALGEQIGAGGMGVVYRATDTGLKRAVALKVLPAAVAGDAERLARFRREAEVLASLNHPNIAAVYGFERVAPAQPGAPELFALVMELVEGPTLAERLAQGPVPMDEAVPIARQIAEALEAAHEQTVVHRDLKPANVKVRPDGTVKVLDFGLAKALEPPAASGASQLPTVTTPAMTQMGMILGTAAYMSPEQAAGKPVDRRTDIWSFGVVLWELVTGRRLFDADSVALTIADVLRAEIPFAALPAATPARVAELLRRCLDRDVRTRLRDIGEARIVLAGPLGVQPARHTTAPPRRGPRWAWLTATACALAAVVMGTLYVRGRVAPLRPVQSSLLVPEASFTSGSGPVISPDGRWIAYVTGSAPSTRALHVRDLEAGTDRVLVGTEGPIRPFWSPDSRSIAFFASGQLKRVEIAGGPAVTLCDVPQTGGGTWSQEGFILLAASNAIVPGSSGTPADLYRIPDTGGQPAGAFPKGDARFQRSPVFLPDGRHFLYTRGSPGADREQDTLEVGDLATGTSMPLFRSRLNAQFVEPGYLLFMREDALMAQRFDLGTLRLEGEAQVIADMVDWIDGPMGAQFSASHQGRLAFTARGRQRLQLTWLDRAGSVVAREGAPVEERSITRFRLSRDGNALAIGRDGDIWVRDRSRGTESRLTAGPAVESSPVWSPDASEIVYAENVSRAFRIHKRSAGGGGAAEDLDGNFQPGDWSRDGRYIVGSTPAFGGSRSDLFVLPTFSARRASALLQTEFAESDPRLSPNGKWVAYHSDASGRQEVYVLGFPGGTVRKAVSAGGGVLPVWSGDGTEIYWREPTGAMMAASVKGDIEFGPPVKLFEADLGGEPVFDVDDNGRFLVMASIDRPASLSITLVQNWTALLR